VGEGVFEEGLGFVVHLVGEGAGCVEGGGGGGWTLEGKKRRHVASDFLLSFTIPSQINPPLLPQPASHAYFFAHV